MSELVNISKFLSLILRHKPDEIGVNMDANGWVDVDELLEKSKVKNIIFDFEVLEEVVYTNDKQRFSFNEDESKIRANQGHSISVDLGLISQVPPVKLYHGTVAKFIESIQKEGLQKGKREYVHLSNDIDTASKVATRRGKPIILEIASLDMHNDGIKLFQSKNLVWLCEYVPVKYILNI